MKKHHDELVAKEIKLTETDKILAEKFLKIRRAERVAARLHNINQWWPIYHAEHPDASLVETIKYMRKTVQELAGKEVFLKQKKRKPQVQLDFEEKFYSFREHMMRRQNQFVSPQQQGAFNYSGPIFYPWLTDLFELFFGPFCDITSGVVSANAIVPYPWAISERSGSTSELTFSARDGADVLDFEGIFIGGDNPVLLELWDWGDTMASLFVLRVTLPPPSRDVMIFYETDAIIGLWEGCTVFDIFATVFGNDDPGGELDIDYVFFEQPEGGQFPSFDSFNWRPGVKCKQTNYDPIEKHKTFFGSMAVKEGVSSNLYVGVSVFFTANDGVRVSTGRMDDPSGGHFQIALPGWAYTPGEIYGVYYIMLPAQLG